MSERKKKKSGMVNEYYESYYRNLEDNTNLRDLKERLFLCADGPFWPDFKSAICRFPILAPALETYVMSYDKKHSYKITDCSKHTLHSNHFQGLVEFD